MLREFSLFNASLQSLPDKKMLISTLNAHSYNVSRQDALFCQALKNSDVLIPDGISIVLAIRWLTGKKITKIAGADLFFYEMKRLEETGGSCFFLGSSPATLDKIKARASREFPHVNVETFSPPYKPEFSNQDNAAMIAAVNAARPQVLFVGMTAPKQEKWAYAMKENLHVGHICCIGAVFDFYAGTVKRAPRFMIRLGLEWLYRLAMEPRRMWKRYLIGNTRYIAAIIGEKTRAK